MAQKVADLRWNEVRYINCYALFMGYLLMAVRGLGFLVITWSTVVLLGGFVSNLEKKDFWSLTIITLVLTPRVSADVGLKGKLRYIGYSILGLTHAIVATLNPNGTKDTWPRRLLAAVVLLCHLLVGPIVVCPLAALYMCGPLFSAGISAWRLIEHDYVVPKKEEHTHLQPALIVLYSLAMLQGFLFCYRFYSSFAREDLVNDVAEEYKMNNIKEAVEEYLRETVNKCEKDPAFFKETNLATYAVGMIKSESSESFLSGAKILDALLEHAPTVTAEERTLTAELISLVASSSHVLEKLLQALDSTSPYGETIRVVAANIVTHLASRIPLMQFPQGIQRIGSLIDISQQQFEDDWRNDYKKLMENGFVILRKLAADEDNCRTISNAQGLLSKVLAPVSSDLLHLIDHEAWSTTIAAASLQVMCRLVAAPGETGARLRRQISSDKEAIHGMERILRCCGCSEHVRILTIQILTHLAMGMDEESVRVNKESRENFIKMLPSIFTDEAKDCSIRKLAGEALLKLSQSENNAAIILKANDHVVRDLSKILLLGAAPKSTNRIMAAKTLKHLYVHYKENDEYLRALKETMEDVMPKILREILPPVVLNGNDTLAENRTYGQSSPLQSPTDIEAQVRAPQDDGRSNNNSTCQQNDDKKLHAALLSLAMAIFDKLITQDHNLAQLVDKISPGDSPTSFANKLNEIVRTKSQPMASCLSMMRNASKMVISMMKHSDSYLKEHFLMIFIQSLSDACKAMSCIESSMILYSANRGPVKPHKTLTSLLKEAQELVGSKEPKER
ncbi:hypothetical protein CFC21_103249 [Triticum aestivum]|uniref:Uncharacterized protein n=3 Tax=Triticum TaxID=4564 RepID=A0A9R1C626_TRITD|nr:uncharacterized protein LOC123160515 isoform X1 [Triticum aestivum]KAF7102063.1 hypothetical protein CFC21_103249 [Triticum aestivum]VAI93646.1 unnamed protein product [Triticum turgidum subsp. durum]